MSRGATAHSRRQFLASLAATGFGLAHRSIASASYGHRAERPKVAAIFSEFRFRSHAYDFLENFFAPYLFNGQLTDPGVEVVSFYADQFPDGDMAREVSDRLKVPLFDSIEQAICRGGRELAVDAVLSIVEQGDYPTNSRSQKMYPRKRFFDESVAVMRRSGRTVPFFNDKHLSFRWDWAHEMYSTARELKFPLMAGSSVPLAERRPAIELPPGSKIDEAVAIHGGGVESYDFHGLELLQSFVESRDGGESGISSVEFLDADAIWQTAENGVWSVALAEAAMTAELGPGKQPPIRRPDSTAAGVDSKIPGIDHGILVRYKDGLRGIVLQIGQSANRWNFACRLGQPVARDSSGAASNLLATALYNGPWGNRCLFKALSHAVQHCFIHKATPYPIERTLMVTGALDAAMLSREQKMPIDTPHLELKYRPGDWRPFRELGKSWHVITKDTPEDRTFTPGDARYVR